MPRSSYSIPQILKAYKASNYFVGQKGTFILVCFGVFGHIFFYATLKYHLNLWESLYLRIGAILIFLSLLLLPSHRNFNSLEAWRYELVFYLTGPVFFTIYLFENDFHLFWSIAFFMTAVIVGGVSAPSKSFWLFPLSVVLTTLGYTQFGAVSNENLQLLLQVLLPSYFTVVMVSTSVVVFGMVYSELEEKNIIIEKNKRQMEEQKTAIETASRSKSMFLANMSHEIRTPLNSIIGFSQILLEQSYEHSFPKESRALLRHIKNGGEHLTNLINNVLDLSKIEADKMELLEEEIHLRNFVSSIFHLHENVANQKGLVLKRRMPNDLPKFIKTDKVKLNQILINLIANAIKFSEKGEITLSAKRNKEYLIFQVCDQGIGISKDRQQAIFESFEQEDNTSTRKFGGSGLGLSITRKMLEILGGAIDIESTLGVGSVFSVSIPLKEVAYREIPQGANITNVKFKQKNRVLVVEDDGLNCIVITKFLESFGIIPTVVNNGKEALDELLRLAIEGELPDLVLMDLHMPVLDGRQATILIKKNVLLSKVPIVALSADALSEQKRNASDVGFSDYLAKPISKVKLLSLLKGYLT